RQHADADRDRTDVVEVAAVDALLRLEDALAHRVVFEIGELLRKIRGEPALRFGRRAERLERVLLERADRVAALQLVADLERLREVLADGALQRGDELVVARRRRPV